MQIEYWRASTNLRMTDEVIDWASETSVQFIAGQRYEMGSPLIDLLFNRQPFKDTEAYYDLAIGQQLTPRLANSPRGYALRESVNFKVEIQTVSPAIAKLQRWLIEHTNEGKMTLWIWLEGQLQRALY